MDTPMFTRVLDTLHTYSEITRNINQGGIATPQLTEAVEKLETAMAKMINALLETEGQVA